MTNISLADRALISVIIPVYNVEKYLNKCIDSVIKQKYGNIEILLVDDGSTDDCPSICDDYARRDNRIKVIHKKNGGLSSARNAGIETAKGEYILFLDSDDFVHEEWVDHLYKFTIDNNADMTICAIQCVKEDGSIEKMQMSQEAPIIWNEQLLWENAFYRCHPASVVAWSKMYKKSIFDNLRFVEGKIHEDEFIIHKIIKYVNKIAYLNEKLYFYRKRSDSIVNKRYSIKRMDAIEAMEDRLFYLIENNADARYVEAAGFVCMKYLQTACEQLDMNNSDNKGRYKELLADFRKVFIKTIGHKCSRRFYRRGIAFFISPYFYLWLRKLNSLNVNSVKVR